MSLIATMDDAPRAGAGALSSVLHTGDGTRDSDGTAPAQTWARAEIEALFHKIVGLTNGKGDTSVTFRMTWTNTLAWVGNRPTILSTTRERQIDLRRHDGDVFVRRTVSQLDDEALKTAITDAEKWLFKADSENGVTVLAPPHDFQNPALWSDATAHVTDHMRGEAARRGADNAMNAKLVSAGKIVTRVVTWAVFHTKGLAAHVTGTSVQYSESVRTPDGKGTGWAGRTCTDWTTLDVAALARTAQAKCVSSARLRTIEPGRYTVVMEPQPVASFMAFAVQQLDRGGAESGNTVFSGATAGTSKIGQQVLDPRVTISTDPTDPECPYLPFDGDGYPYQPTTWIEKGILKALSYDTAYARHNLGTSVPLSNPNAFRMSGGETTIEQMIASTERGVLLTRFGDMHIEDFKTVLLSTYTRDGLWLIEHGKVTSAVKNMSVLESPLFIGNKIEQLGPPERTFGMHWLQNYAVDLSNYPPEALGNLPIVAPPLKVRDFNFNALTDAV